jgi:hypothetical protein
VLNSNSISYILVTAHYFQALLVILDLFYKSLLYHYLTTVKDGSLLLSHTSVREPLHLNATLDIGSIIFKILFAIFRALD